MKQENCRLCLYPLGEPVLKFPDTPLANEFLKTKEEQDKFPLQVCCCEQCGHYQLNETVDPERLFRHYLFVSGTSKVNVEHFRQYAIDLIDQCKLDPGMQVLDIASNDGTLLKEFQKLGMKVLGIDPARNIADQANKEGIETIAEFFTEEYADTILKQYGQFELITANNVWAHVPDMIGFVKGIKKILAYNGVFIFEVSYFIDVCNNTLIDTVYHEHSSYHTINPLISFFEKLDLKIVNVKHIDNHGGSIRVYVKNKTNITNVFVSDEINPKELIEQLKINIKKLGKDLNKILKEYKAAGKSIAIYGTPAKATTLMYALDVDESIIDFAVDDAPLKQGTFTPGKHIPVMPSSAIQEKNPDVLLVLAWNFADSIMDKCRKSGYKGKFIIPLPELRIIE
jgi:SAM-dependent methyltransferase